MLDKTIEEITSELLTRSGLNVPVSLENRFPNGRLVGGKYNLGTRSITMYLDTVKEQCQLLFGSISHYLNYYAIVLAHELGHATDESLAAIADLLAVANEAESRKLLRMAEEKAWEAARELVFDIDEGLFAKVRDTALDMHR
ncbi:hypothetical protein [Peribacillus kribbensis]|uniref:hypothetical protein n=1 Tax=Peribacillus kribbensis TaxID=356658 RepID=UPI00042369E2|nr:hypothetical protein [Peribacillus kribbensis]